MSSTARRPASFRGGWRIAVGAALIAVAASPLGARQLAQDAQAEREAAIAELVPELQELADWCQKNKLYGRRDQVYAALVHFDPDCKKARRVLRYKKRRDGWYRSAYHPPRDRNPEALADFECRIGMLVSVYRQKLDGLFYAANECDPHGVWADLIALDPQDEEAHAALGEVRSPLEEGPEWVLRETATALERRARQREAIARALDAPLRLEEAAGLEFLDEVGLRWQHAVVSEDFVLSGTCTEAELEECARHLRALVALLELCFPETAGLPGDLVVYALAKSAHSAAFLRSHPGFDAATERITCRQASYWVPGESTLVVVGKTQAERLQHLVRETIDLFLRFNYEIEDLQGWAYEGVGILLTRALLGEDLPRPGTRPEERPALAGAPAVVLREGSGWWGWARHLMQSEQRPTWSELDDKPVSELCTEDRVYSSALARYLVEARPRAAHELFTLLAQDVSLAHALRRVLDMDTKELEQRLRRWTEEMPPEAES